MSEKLLPCPFCGGEARTFEYDGANQATCGGKHIDCAGTDVVAPVAMWNRRTPAPEGEVVTERLRKIMGHLKNLNTEHSRQRNCPSRGYDEDAALGEMTHLSSAIDAELDAIDALYASPVVPVGVSREDIARLLHAIVDSDGTIVRVEEAVDAILATLRFTDTGRE